MHFLEKDENFINFPVFLRLGKTETHASRIMCKQKVQLWSGGICFSSATVFTKLAWGVSKEGGLFSSQTSHFEEHSRQQAK